MNHRRVLVTGDRDDWASVGTASGAVEFISVPVLEYARLPIRMELLEHWLVQKPAEWIVFTSPRAVRFWSEVLLENGFEFPVETRVACVGSRTAEVASEEGYCVDFAPRQPGTEGFLEEFEKVTSPASVLIPAAAGGRLKIRDRLQRMGYEVTWTPLYETRSKSDIAHGVSAQSLETANAIVFTSPSSVDAFLDAFQLPENVRIIAIGGFTGKHLESKGYVRPRLLPGGDFSRIEEALS